MSQAKNHILKKKLRMLLFLFLTAAIIKFISLDSSFVEKYYSTGVYIYISSFLRTLTGWLPLSLGDVLYFLAAIYLLIKSIKNIIAVFKKEITKESFLFGVIKVIRVSLWVYIIFNFFWGLNYNRLGIAYQLGIKPKEYSTAELKNLTHDLVTKVNDARHIQFDYAFQSGDNNSLFKEAENAYRNVQYRYSFLNYQQPCVKTTLFGKLGNYLGFMGYYNPFTGEAQVNTSIPRFLLPYTTTHEMAHQLGYGDEDEANFVGYLAAKSADENAFHYSVYFDLFNYANRALFYRDSITARANYKSLDTLVKQDEITFRNFLIENQNPADRYITVLYGDYLKANNQPHGMDTYDEVIEWLIAYQKKYGEL